MKKILYLLMFSCLVAVKCFGQTITTQSTGGASNSLSSGFTGVLPVVNGGSGQTLATGTGSMVKSTSPTITTPIITVSRQTMGDANATYSATVTQVALTATISATRTVTLCAANSFAAGTSVEFVDEIGTISSTKNIKIKRTSTNTISGDTMVALSSPYTSVRFVTDGSSKWTLINMTVATTNSWVPTFTGFSANPTVTTWYEVRGKVCYFAISNVSAGTSNATTTTFTLPVAPSSTAITSVIMSLQPYNNTAWVANGVAKITAGTSTVDCYLSAFGAWTNTGGKSFNVSGFYPVD